MRAPFQILAIPYRIVDGTPMYCVFHRADHDQWQFIAGGGEDNETPLAAALDPGVGMLHAVKAEAAVGRRLQAADQTDEGGLARAVSPHKAIDRALGDVHIQAIQRREAAVALAEPIGLKHIFHVIYLLCLIARILSGKGQESGQETPPEIVKIPSPAGSRCPRPPPHSPGRRRCAACPAGCSHGSSGSFPCSPAYRR